MSFLFFICNSHLLSHTLNILIHSFIYSTYIQIRRNPNEPPLSPTHYQQPGTPEHAPPSAAQAERYIHERIRPLSQVSGDTELYVPMNGIKNKLLVRVQNVHF